MSEKIALSASTKLYISLSKSPSLFGSTVYNALFSKHGIDAIYLPRVAPESAEQAVSSVRSLKISGCSVSMPLKAAMGPLMDELDETAKRTGSVNTIINRDGKLFGANTDCLGIGKALERHKFQSALVYGYGATASSMIFALRQMKIPEICCTGRSPEKASEFARKTGIEYLKSHSAQTRRFDLLANVTPVSIEPAGDLCSLIECARCVFDVVIQPKATPFLEKAKSTGHPIITGTEMYCFQVQAQFRLYFGITPTIEEIVSALKEAKLITA